jgi:hypothetical protein
VSNILRILEFWLALPGSSNFTTGTLPDTIAFTPQVETCYLICGKIPKIGYVK